MRTTTSRIPTKLAAATALGVTALAAGALGCGGATDERAAAEAAIAIDTAPNLTTEDVERLALRYPALGAARAAEPQPGATPDRGAVPASVRALPAHVRRTVTGEATYYADSFEGRRTASGIPFRQNQLVAAHRAYPFGTLLRVTNTRNDRSVNVRVVDRGPWGARAEARNTIIDLSRRAAERLGYTDAGRAPVRVEVLEWGGPLVSAG